MQVSFTLQCNVNKDPYEYAQAIADWLAHGGFGCVVVTPVLKDTPTTQEVIQAVEDHSRAWDSKRLTLPILWT